jgi:hypothetical protein
MTKDEILEEYGDDLSDGAIQTIVDYFSDVDHGNTSNDYIVVNSKMEELLEDGTSKEHLTPGILAGLEVHPLNPYNTDEWATSIRRRVIPVYECQ